MTARFEGFRALSSHYWASEARLFDHALPTYMHGFERVCSQFGAWIYYIRDSGFLGI